MNTGLLNSEFGTDQHPEETQLLLALEKELPAAEAAAVERHVGTCWECRARYHEMHRGILAFVEYRDKLYLPELDAAPKDFRQFPQLLNREAADGREARLLDRIGSWVRSFLRFAGAPLRVRWVTATAFVMTAVVFWTQLFSPAAVSASELLVKAAQSQNPSTPVHRKVRQKVLAMTGAARYVREFQWETGSPIPGATWGTDPGNWTAPITAQGFSEWHDSLSAPNDKVRKSGDRWTLNTVASAGPIREASIVIHTGDFQPIEQHIRFSDDRTLDLRVISFEMAEPAPAVSSSAQVHPVAPPVTKHAEPPVSAPAINLDEAELELRYAMFLRRFDNDEDLQISRAADAVVLSGIASSAERLNQIQDLAAGLQGVRVSVSAPALRLGGSASVPTEKLPAGSALPLLKDRLDSALPSVAARRDFVDSCLSISDSALSDASALKRLAYRYTGDARRNLKSESQAKIDEMIREHLDRIAAANAKLSGLLDLLPPSQSAHDDSGTVSPRAGVTALFDLVQRQDSLVAALVAGTQTTDTVAVIADNLRAGHQAIARLVYELKPGDGKTVK